MSSNTWVKMFGGKCLGGLGVSQRKPCLHLPAVCSIGCIAVGEPSYERVDVTMASSAETVISEMETDIDTNSSPQSPITQSCSAILNILSFSQSTYLRPSGPHLGKKQRLSVGSALGYGKGDPGSN